MNEPHWDHLIQRYLDDALTGSELAEFESLMLESASARRRFWELAEIHGVARESARLAWVLDEAEAAIPDRLRTSPNLTMEQKMEPMVPPQQTELKRCVGWLSWRPLAAAACVLLLAGLVSIWQWNRRTALVAEMIDSPGARWESSTLPTQPGSMLNQGRLRLAEGLARIRFARGADVTLEGPAELELIGPQVCRLHCGSLVAHVPESAHGFSVLTPSATLIDHGTDFGISTDELGHANVQVMQGEVELRHASGAPPLRLTTREMAAITPEKLLPAMPLEVEPRRSSASIESKSFTTEITTRTGNGAAAYVSEPRTERNQSNTLLLLKHCAEPGYGRKVLLRFDLAAIHDASSITQARLTLNFGPSGYGYASHGDNAHIVVYALTQDDADLWSAAELNWDTQPAFDSSAGRVDESKAVRVGEIIVPRGVQTGVFSIENPKLIERIKADPNRLLTLILVRENRIEQAGGLVLGIAGNNHSTLSPPTLRVR